MELNFTASMSSFLMDKWWDTKTTSGYIGALFFVLGICFFMEFLNWFHDQIKTKRKLKLRAEKI